MDWQMIINIGGACLLGIVGWWCREIWDSIKAMKHDIKQIEVSLPTNYVSKIEINTRLDKIDNVLERIFDRLDEKADK